MLDNKNRTTLQNAIADYQHDRAEQLIVAHRNDRGYLDHADNWGFTAMHYAAEVKSMTLVRLLFENGSRSIHSPSYEGRTPLSLFIGDDRANEFIEFLLENTDDGSTILHRQSKTTCTLM